MPYNYIIDWTIRKNLFLNLSNSIIIFDEAHNVPSVAESVASFELTVLKLEKVIKELNFVAKIVSGIKRE